MLSSRISCEWCRPPSASQQLQFSFRQLTSDAFEKLSVFLEWMENIWFKSKSVFFYRWSQLYWASLQLLSHFVLCNLIYVADRWEQTQVNHRRRFTLAQQRTFISRKSLKKELISPNFLFFLCRNHCSLVFIRRRDFTVGGGGRRKQTARLLVYRVGDTLVTWRTCCGCRENENRDASSPSLTAAETLHGHVLIRRRQQILANHNKHSCACAPSCQSGVQPDEVRERSAHHSSHFGKNKRRPSCLKAPLLWYRTPLIHQCERPIGRWSRFHAEPGYGPPDLRRPDLEMRKHEFPTSWSPKLWISTLRSVRISICQPPPPPTSHPPRRNPVARSSLVPVALSRLADTPRGPRCPWGLLLNLQFHLRTSMKKRLGKRLKRALRN